MFAELRHAPTVGRVEVIRSVPSFCFHARSVNARSCAAPSVKVSFCRTSRIAKFQPDVLCFSQILLLVRTQHLANNLIGLVELFISGFGSRDKTNGSFGTGSWLSARCIWGIHMLGLCAMTQNATRQEDQPVSPFHPRLHEGHGTRILAGGQQRSDRLYISNHRRLTCAFCSLITLKAQQKSGRS